MIPILTRTLWQRRWYILWWSVGVAAYMALVVGVYPPFRDQAATLNHTFSSLPQAAKSLIADTNNFFSPEGYLSANAYYLMLPIIFGIVCIGLGSSLLARDEQDHTLELLLSRPVSRGRVLVARALAGLCILAVIALSTSAATMVLAWLVKLHIPLAWLAEATVMSAGLALIFGALAFMFTALGRGARAASVGIATLLLFASYLFTSLSGTVHWLSWPAKLLPYNYYHPTDVLAGKGNWNEAIIILVVVILFGAVSYIGFRRRDIS